MPTLQDVLAGVPGLGGYLAQRQINEGQGMQQLQQAGTLQQIFAQAAAQKEKQRKIEQEQAFRQGLQALGPNPDPNALAAVAAQFSEPKDLLTTQQRSIDRQETNAATAATKEAALAAQKEAMQARLDQQKQNAEMVHEFRMASLKTDADRAAETARHNRMMEGLQGQMAQLRSDQIGIAKTPSGYRPTPEGNLQAIPGGPADTKLQGALNADTASLQASEAALNRLAEQVNLVKDSNLGRITGILGVAPNVPGSAGSDAQSRLDALKSQVGFSVLQTLKDAARTGASGLGQVTEKEHVYLQQQLGNLTKAQSEKEIRRVLDDIARFTEGAKDRLRNAYNLKHGNAQPAAAAPSSGAWGIRPLP